MRALIFDYDGLIVDTERLLAECIIEVLGELGAVVRLADFAHLFGSIEMDHEWDRLLTLWLGREMTSAEFDALVWPRYDEVRRNLAPLPGAVELVQAAHDAGWRVGLATGNDRASVLRQLRCFGVADMFDTVVGRGGVRVGKPAPDIFLKVADDLGVATGRCVVLEDSVPGCVAALAAGMRVVACPSIVTAHCEFPPDALRVASLLDVHLDEFE
ncbi:MAG: HAD family hydrolase [Acidimicrobiales bacterium]